LSVSSLFQAIRTAASSGCWSRGVELARRDTVSTVRTEGGEITLRVAAQGGLVSPEVFLYPEDHEWDCECDAADDPCQHVTAAVIALKHARDAGRELPEGGQDGGGIGYRFTRRGRELEFARAVVGPAGEIPLQSSMTAIALGRVEGPAFVATEADNRIERYLDGRLRGVLPRAFMPKLLRLLSECEDIRLDGDPIRASGEPVLPVVSVDDHGDGFFLKLGPDVSVGEAFANGVALCGELLRPIEEAHLSQRERELLVEGRYYPPGQVAELVSELLPSLESRVTVERRTQRLPRSQITPPRLLVQVRREADSLGVLPMLVYGDPPNARIVEDEMVHLRGGPVPLRDRAAEERLLRQLRRELDLVPGHGVRLDAGQALAFAERLRGFSGSVEGDAHQQFFLAPPLEPRIELDADHFEVEFATLVDGRSAHIPIHRALSAWQRGQSLVPLTGGGFAELPVDWMQRYGQTVADLLAARGGSETLPAFALPDLARLCSALGESPPPRFERLRVLVEDFDGLPEATLPDDLEAELRPYQLRGVRWLQFLRDSGLGGLLADDMGLGKTLQALCGLRGRTLVVAPTSVVYGWQEQIERFRPGLRASLYHGPRRQLDSDAPLTLTTYGVLRVDAERLADVHWDTVVLDEAQAIKNPDSQVARAAHSLRGDFRLTLTGTPVQNRLDELWSQLHFLNPGLLGTRQDFRHRYETPIAEGKPGVAARLRERIRPFLLRRIKDEVAPELPPRTEAVLHCELSDTETSIYEAVRAATHSDLVERLQAGGGVLEALEALLRLRQAACHPALLPGRDAAGSSKVDVLLEALEEVIAEDHKALVFSQWTSFLDLVEPHLHAAGLPFGRLDGSTRDRAGVITRFQDQDGPPVLLISLRAGGVGLNLTAADHVFLLDPWWNPAVEDQAADRAHRIGQDRPVMVYRLVSRETVEERILALQARKRAVAEAVLEGTDRATSITREELLALLD